MPFIPPHYFFILLGVSETGLALFKRAGSSAKDRDRGSFLALWGVIGAAIYAAIHLTFSSPQFALDFHPGVYWMAVLLFVGGLGLRWWSIVHLGRFFTVNVAIAEDHRVVDNCPYTLIRHPSYTGALIAFCGLGLMLCNWLAALVLVLPVLLMFSWRIAVEERALKEALGAPYDAYMKRTKRLVPWVV